ncbi:MAG: thiamine-phosphate kinase [Thermoanaerobaculia bacterium]
MTKRGEDLFTARLSAAARPGRGLRVGIGDDGAVVDLPRGRYVVTTDTLVEGIDFLARENAEWIGRRAAGANLSDLAAMGAQPLGALLTLGIPRRRTPGFAWKIARGAIAKLEPFGARLWGGDVSRSREIFVTICLIGKTPHPVTRRGARAGDLVYLTGEPGASFRGLAARKRRRRGAPSAEERRYLDPEPRVRFGAALSAGRLASAMIDVSDGLGKDAHRLAAASGVALVLRGVDRKTLLLPSDDFELLFTAPPKNADAIRRAAKRTRTPLCEIGRAAAGRGVFWTDGRRRAPIADAGYDHFLR